MDPNTYLDENTPIEHTFTVNPKVSGARLDRYVVQHVPGYSRTVIQRMIKEGNVQVNGRPSKVAYMVEVGDRIDVKVPTVRKVEMIAQKMEFDILYEDDVLLAVDKPPGLIIHPGTGRIDGTLANGLMHYFNESSEGRINDSRVGIIHRIDKGTTGMLLVAKTPEALAHVQKQFAERTVRKQYLCFVEGAPEFDEGEVNLPIGHDRKQHTRRAIRREEEGGKASLTGYTVLERFGECALVQCRPKTGRTHQIRVHMKALGHPLLIDETYGSRKAVFLSDLNGRPREEGEKPLIDRLTLHAHRIEFEHPVTGEAMKLEAPLHADMQKLKDALQRFQPERTSIGRQRGRRTEK